MSEPGPYPGGLSGTFGYRPLRADADAETDDPTQTNERQPP